MKIQVYTYNHKCDYKKYIPRDIETITVNAAAYDGKDALSIYCDILIGDTLADDIETKCCAIDDFDDALENDIYLIFWGFEDCSSDRVSEILQESFSWVSRCNHLRAIFFIPLNKCNYSFQDSSKIKQISADG